MGDKWKFRGDISNTLANFTTNLKMRNKSVYGHITTRKKNLTNKLTDIQRRIDLFGSNKLAQLELRIR